MEKREDGDFTATVEVAAGKEYRFRYLIDGQRWENDWHADKYVKGPYGAEDSVVCA
jgi:1,4-alpha-glucan branching enzyme